MQDIFSLFTKENNHYQMFEELMLFELELSGKIDEALVEDIYDKVDKRNLRQETIDILTKYNKTLQLSPEDRIKLQALFILIYGEHGYAE